MQILILNQVDFDKIIVEADNKLVIQMLEGKILIPMQICNIIQDINVWRNQVIQVITNHIYNEVEMATD